MPQDGMISIDCPLEYLSRILPQEFTVSAKTTLRSKSTSICSSLNQSWSSILHKRLTAVYHSNESSFIKINCEYNATIYDPEGLPIHRVGSREQTRSSPVDNEANCVYYNRLGYFALNKVNLKIFARYAPAAVPRMYHTNVAIYDRDVNCQTGDIFGAITHLSDKARLALSGQYKPDEITFANSLKVNPVKYCKCVSIVTLGANGIISDDINNPNSLIYFLLELHIPNGLPLIDTIKGHLPVITDGKVFYLVTRTIDRYTYLVQKDIPELLNVDGNVIPMAQRAISNTLRHAGLSNSRTMLNGMQS